MAANCSASNLLRAADQPLRGQGRARRRPAPGPSSKATWKRNSARSPDATQVPAQAGVRMPRQGDLRYVGQGHEARGLDVPRTARRGARQRWLAVSWRALRDRHREEYDHARGQPIRLITGQGAHARARRLGMIDELETWPPGVRRGEEQGQAPSRPLLPRQRRARNSRDAASASGPRRSTTRVRRTRPGNPSPDGHHHRRPARLDLRANRYQHLVRMTRERQTWKGKIM